MTTTAPDVHDALVKAGVDQAVANAIARGLARPTGPSAMSVLTAATLAGFTLLGLGLGWVKSDLADVRTELRTEINAVNGQLSSVGERLTRIETLLDERLPARP